MERLNLSTVAWGLYMLSLIPAGKVSYDSTLALRELNEARTHEVKAIYPDLDWRYINQVGVDRYIPSPMPGGLFGGCPMRFIDEYHKTIDRDDKLLVRGFISCEKPKDIEAQVELLNEISRRDKIERYKAELGSTLPFVYGVCGLMFSLTPLADKITRYFSNSPLPSWLDWFDWMDPV